MIECENYALQGDIQSIKETLQELINIPTRVQRTGDLLRLSFYTKIKHLISKNKFKSAENIIYSYIDIFGLDTEIKTLMRTYEKLYGNKLAITANQNLMKERNVWLNSEFIVGEYCHTKAN